MVHGERRSAKCPPRHDATRHGNPRSCPAPVPSRKASSASIWLRCSRATNDPCNELQLAFGLWLLGIVGRRLFSRWSVRRVVGVARRRALRIARSEQSRRNNDYRSRNVAVHKWVPFSERPRFHMKPQDIHRNGGQQPPATPFVPQGVPPVALAWGGEPLYNRVFPFLVPTPRSADHARRAAYRLLAALRPHDHHEAVVDRGGDGSLCGGGGEGGDGLAAVARRSGHRPGG